MNYMEKSPWKTGGGAHANPLLKNTIEVNRVNLTKGK
jgi:hypothetical protein